jgi:adenylosuccinate lyase
VWPNVIARHIDEELPFMATESIIMACVKAGGDRQEVHEAIRQHSMAAARQVKERGLQNDLLERLGKDPVFKAVHETLPELLDPRRFVGRAPEQVQHFLETDVDPVLERLLPEVKSGAEEVAV